MTAKEYRIAYKVLKLRATVGGIKAMQPLDKATNEQRKKIIMFLTTNHQLKFI